MEEDLKVLEEMIRIYKQNRTGYFINNTNIEAIENLIKVYKELDIENKTLKAHKNGCPALSTTGVECEFKKDLEKLQEGDK